MQYRSRGSSIENPIKPCNSRRRAIGALGLGPRGRRFESCRPVDDTNQLAHELILLRHETIMRYCETIVNTAETPENRKWRHTMAVTHFLSAPYDLRQFAIDYRIPSVCLDAVFADVADGEPRPIA